MKAERHLVLGGARSGKTRHATERATSLQQARGEEVVYVATAEAGDAEMENRIARHRKERPAHWRTIEAPQELGRILSGMPSNTIVVVDCLTLWLSNALLNDFRDEEPMAALPTWDAQRDEFMEYLRSAPHSLILVSNEVGAGIVPQSPLARRFQDEQGWLNQATAAACDRVTLVIAGIALDLQPGAQANRSS